MPSLRNRPRMIDGLLLPRRFPNDRLGELAAGGRAASGIVPAPYWLWYESFAVAAAAPLTSGLPASPGPGLTHYAGTTGSKSGGNYVENVGASAAGPYQNTGYARTLVPQAMVAFGANWSRITTNIIIGFAPSAGYAASSGRPGLVLSASFQQYDGLTAQTTHGTLPMTSGSAWDVLVIADSIGGYGLYRASGTIPWTLAGLTRFDTTTPIYGRAGGTNYAATFAAAGLALGVQRPRRHTKFAASGAQGVVTLPSADFILGMRITSTATNGVRFRRVDGNNHFRAERTNAGALRIVRVDSGSDTVVSTSAMTAAANDRLYLRLEGNAVRISGHPTGGTWVNPSGATITQHTSGLGIEVMDESAYDSLEVYPLTHAIQLPETG